jgi:cytochrome c-type biogenesis protein CcmH/NrfF
MKALLAGVVLSLVIAGPALATPEDVANAVSREVMSPYCEGVTLHDCPSREALELRERIATWAADGMSKGAIIDRLVSEFGPQIRAVPAKSGIGLLAWLLPAAGLLIAVGVAAALTRRFSARGAVVEPDAPQLSPEQRARLDAELEAFGGTS